MTPPFRPRPLMGLLALALLGLGPQAAVGALVHGDRGASRYLFAVYQGDRANPTVEATFRLPCRKRQAYRGGRLTVAVGTLARRHGASLALLSFVAIGQSGDFLPRPSRTSCLDWRRCGRAETSKGDQ